MPRLLVAFAAVAGTSARGAVHRAKPEEDGTPTASELEAAFVPAEPRMDIKSSSFLRATNFIRAREYAFPHPYKVSGTVNVESSYQSQTITWDLENVDKLCGRSAYDDPNKSQYGDELMPYGCGITIHTGKCCEKGEYEDADEIAEGDTTDYCDPVMDPGPTFWGSEYVTADPWARSGKVYDALGGGKGTLKGKNPANKLEPTTKGGYGHLGYARSGLHNDDPMFARPGRAGGFTVTTGKRTMDLIDGRSIVIHGYGNQGPIACANLEVVGLLGDEAFDDPLEE